MSKTRTFVELVDAVIEAARTVQEEGHGPDPDYRKAAERDLVEAKVRLLAALPSLATSRPTIPDQTFCLGQSEHYALVDQRVFGPWADVGAARAGLVTEQRRAARRMEKAAARKKANDEAARHLADLRAGRGRRR